MLRAAMSEREIGSQLGLHSGQQRRVPAPFGASEVFPHSVFPSWACDEPAGKAIPCRDLVATTQFCEGVAYAPPGPPAQIS